MLDGDHHSMGSFLEDSLAQEALLEDRDGRVKK